MMTSYIAVLRLYWILIWSFILKDLEVGAMLAPEESKSAHDSARMHIQMRSHPVVISYERT